MNLKKLKGLLVEKDVTQTYLADKMGITLQSLNAKLNGRTPMTIDEAWIIVQELKIENPGDIFFA